MKRETKKGIVIAGGGANGDFTAGKLHQRKDTSYFMGHGISTGALMLIAVLVGKWEVLLAYVNTSNKMIFNKAPFRKTGFPRIAFWIARILKSLIVKRVNSIGESKPLRKLVGEYYNESIFAELKDQGKIAIVAAYSITKQEIHNAQSNYHDWEEFKNFIVASASAPLVMSIESFGRTKASPIEEWTDAGVTDNFNAAILFEKGCTEVDLYLHISKSQMKRKGKTKNVIHNAIRTFKSIHKGNAQADLLAGIRAAEFYKGILRVHYMPEHLAKRNPFYFSRDRMTSGFNEGVQLAYDQSLIDTYNYNGKA